MFTLDIGAHGAARVTVFVPCVCVCVSGAHGAARVTVFVPCVCVCVSVRSLLPPRASRLRSPQHRKTVIVIFAKNASFRSYGVICLPPMPPATLKPQTTDTKGIN